MAGDLTVANLNGVPPVQLATDEIVQADGSHIKNQITGWADVDFTVPSVAVGSFGITGATDVGGGIYSSSNLIIF